MTNPETRAAEVLGELPATVWDGRSLPVPVEDIADSYLRLRVCESEDLAGIPGAPPLPDGESLSGLLVVGARQIWVNAAEAKSSPGRRRFTIGHEMGHWCLHRDEHDRVFCRSSHVLPDSPAEDTGPDIEDEASRFAGALMFPEHLVRDRWTRLRGDLARMCERFGASKVATERAVFRIIRLPEVRADAPDVAVFFWDDDAYDAWRLAHQADGYVVNGALTDDGDAKLHRMSCHYLNRAVRAGQPRTQSPKWCSLDAGELRRVFPNARRCTSCRL